jgi:hypothetical protein
VLSAALSSNQHAIQLSRLRDELDRLVANFPWTESSQSCARAGTAAIPATRPQVRLTKGAVAGAWEHPLGRVSPYGPARSVGR